MDFGTHTRGDAPRHKVFLSFQHRGDSHYREQFVREFGAAFVDHSVRYGDIPDHLPTERVQQLIRDEYIRDATVTIVLVGATTWQRKHVDWEIDASLRRTKLNSRTGLLGILLPSYSPLRGPQYVRPDNWPAYQIPTQPTAPPRNAYSPNNIPPRLWDNVEVGFATVRPWPTSTSELRRWIDEASVRRDQTPYPKLSRDRYGRNRSEDQTFWTD